MFMCRSFAPQSRQTLEEAEVAYSGWSATEASTTQMAALRSNRLGGGFFAASLRCVLSHRDTMAYAPSAAPRSAPKMLAAIGTATSAEVP